MKKLSVTMVLVVILFSVFTKASGPDANFERIKSLFLTSGKPHPKHLGLREGRCFRESDRRVVAVNLMLYRDNEANKNYAILVGQREHLADKKTAFKSNQGQSLNNPADIGFRGAKLVDQASRILESSDSENFLVHSSQTGIFTMNRLKNKTVDRGDRYTYHASDKDEITAQINRTDGSIEYCEFGKILRDY